MPYEFTEFPREPEPQPAASRGRKPPGKSIGVLDFVPPEPYRTPSASRVPRWLTVLAWALLALAYALLYFFGK